MTTARDLLTVTMDMPSTRTVERGDLSLALAGAELTDLLSLGAAGLDGGRITPGPPASVPDRLLGEAAASMTRTEPYETVEEWLWRRGRGLADAYLDAFTEEGQLTRERHRRWLVLGSSDMVLADSADRRRAADRWESREPVLVALATTIGVSGHPAEPGGPAAAVDSDLVPSAGEPAEPPSEAPTEFPAEVAGPAVAAVLSAVVDAVTELSVERHHRDRRLEDAREANFRRGF
jgi:hypothetical protein